MVGHAAAPTKGNILPEGICAALVDVLRRHAASREPVLVAIAALNGAVPFTRLSQPGFSASADATPVATAFAR